MKSLVLAMVVFFPLLSFSQDSSKTVKYAFSLEFGPVISLVSNDRYVNWNGEMSSSLNKVAGNVALSLEVVNGVSIKEKYRLGVGTGYHFNIQKGTKGGFLPFYADFRWIPVKGEISPILVQRIGGVLWTTDDYSYFMNKRNPVGIYYSAGIGVHVRSKRRISGSFLFNYQMYHRTGQSEYWYPQNSVTASQILSQFSIKAAMNF